MNNLLGISKDEVKKAINRLKRRKAPGYDKISSEVLKAGDKRLLTFFIKSSTLSGHKKKHQKRMIFKNDCIANPQKGRQITERKLSCYLSPIDTRKGFSPNNIEQDER